jgi:hypothetical protein
MQRTRLFDMIYEIDHAHGLMTISTLRATCLVGLSVTILFPMFQVPHAPFHLSNAPPLPLAKASPGQITILATMRLAPASPAQITILSSTTIPLAPAKPAQIPAIHSHRSVHGAGFFQEAADRTRFCENG